MGGKVEQFWDLLYLTPKQLLIALGYSVAFIVVVALSSEHDPRKIGGFADLDTVNQYILMPDDELTEVRIFNDKWSNPICNPAFPTHEIGWALDQRFNYYKLNEFGQMTQGEFPQGKLQWRLLANYTGNREDIPPRSCFRVGLLPNSALNNITIKVKLLPLE